MARRRLFYLGLIVIIASVILGIVTYYYPGYPVVGDGLVYRITNLEKGKQEVTIVAPRQNNRTQGAGFIYLSASYPDYPLR